MHPPINLLHLKFFCDAVIYKSISKAAKKNDVTQSALSQAIKKLERIFGTELILHNRPSLQPTEEGKIIFEQARMIFKAVQGTFDSLTQTKEQLCGVVRFVTTKSLGMSFIAPSYKTIKENLPAIDFKFQMRDLNLIRAQLRRQEVDFAIVVHDHNFRSFAKHPLKKGLLRLYKSKKMPLKLIEEGVFVGETEGMYVKQLASLLAEQKSPLHVQDAIAGWELVARFTELGIGVGFFPDYIVSSNRYPNIEPYPLNLPAFDYEICAIYNNGSKLSRSAQAFLDQFSSDP